MVSQISRGGCADAQNILGDIYGENYLIPRDEEETVKWYRKAAEQGHAVAQTNLGFAYAIGQGVKQDFVQAHMWLSLAADQGDDRARKGLEGFKGLTPAQLEKAEALAKEWRATHP